ncbi:hypothetical protein IAQ61_000671 [Plenodomus lingam]|uniref:GPI anchored protein n=1 Tax=Leptosphaeria maculans (strain JN3 / isolate v23.1.3 / race Av1-4-5-6-7-8) TaxID=985895 RepID=E5A6G9_LEPMJ|nr:predicted protein [Plenodomus lingam JN3]KAH9880380.1 hypothetical protein IAQ61_000671 [Plenodomus lingam]CBX99214.1 predicted protein [Plenodomus lingam JN3]
MLPALILTRIMGITLAQDASPTLEVPFIGFWPAFMPHSSVVTAEAKATTISIACPPSQPCGLYPKETIVYGPSTYNIDMSDPDTDFTSTVDCSLATPWIVCKETAGGSEADFPGSSTTSYEAAELTSLSVSITAGAEKLNGSGDSAATVSNSTQGAVSTGAVSGGIASAMPSVTPIVGSRSASGSASACQTSGGTPATISTAAAAANGGVFANELVGAAVGVWCIALVV